MLQHFRIRFKEFTDFWFAHRLLIAGTVFEMEALQRSLKVKFGDLQITFPSPEDFIILKLVVNREKDWQDCKNVALRHFDQLDRGHIRKWMMTFSGTKGNSILVERAEKFFNEIDSLGKGA